VDPLPPTGGSIVGTVSPIAMKLSVDSPVGGWMCAEPRCCLVSMRVASAKRGSRAIQ